MGLVLGSSIAQPTVQAQILNIEKRRLEKKEGNFFVGNVGVHFNYNNRSPTLRQPARVMDTGLTSNLAYFTEDHVFMLINEYQIYLINDSEIVNAGLTHARAQFFREAQVGFEVYSQFQYDRPRGMRRRGLLGAGPRFRLVQSKKINLTAGTGVMYEQEFWRFPEDDGYAVARFAKWSSYVSTRIEPREGFNLNAIIYYQTGYDRTFGFFRHRVSGDMNLSVALIEKLSLTSTFSISYETEPIVPIIPVIFATLNGIRVDF
jgi:hypothetical protein